MAHNYNGDATGVTPATAIQVAIPDDGDPDNVASVNPTAFQRLTNWFKFLFTFAGFMGGAAGGASYNNVGPAGGTAFRATGGGGNSAGLSGTGTGTGPGVIGFAGAGSAGIGVFGTTDGSEAGVKGTATGVGGGTAGEFDSSAGTGSALKATAVDESHLALEIPEGAMQMNGAFRAANLAVNNLITPGTLIKGWAYITTAGGVATLQAGQNVAAISLPAIGGGFGHGVQVNWASGFAGTGYAVFHCNAPDGGGVPKNYLTSNRGQVAGNVIVGFFDTGANAPVDPNGSNVGVIIVALGEQ